VDDLISGAKSKEEAVIIMDQALKLLAKGKFKLRKWCSNVSAVLDEDKDKESYLKFDQFLTNYCFPFPSYSHHQAPGGDLSCLQ